LADSDCPNSFQRLQTKKSSRIALRNIGQRVCVKPKISVSWSVYEKISEKTQEEEEILEENAQKGKMERIRENVESFFVLAYHGQWKMF
jgi:hypothetical protein